MAGRSEECCLSRREVIPRTQYIPLLFKKSSAGLALHAVYDGARGKPQAMPGNIKVDFILDRAYNRSISGLIYRQGNEKNQVRS
jgi:hypothetical protein